MHCPQGSSFAFWKGKLGPWKVILRDPSTDRHAGMG